jgi:hypothetical protein
VAIGDSLAQGMQSGAIFANDLSFPSLIAHEMGLTPAQFRFPTYHKNGGMPLNLEWMLRRLEAQYGVDLQTLEMVGAPFAVRAWMDDIEDYWEKGPGTAPRRGCGPFHNLACWGMTVDDMTHLRADYCYRQARRPTRDDLWKQVPERAFYRNALTVINPGHERALMNDTVFDSARRLSADGGVENLLIVAGANNALGTITALDVKPTTDAILSDPIGNRTRFNLWRPEHFAVAYERLAAEAESVSAQRVFLTTVPHVTIAPLVRGVGHGLKARTPVDPRYFQYYTLFWIRDKHFNPGKDPHLTGKQAIQIDATVDQYNQIIRGAVDERRRRGLDWHVIDLGGALERLAFRRYREIGMVPPGGFYPVPNDYLLALQAAGLPELTTQFLQTDGERICQGGLFSLDGVHPTAMGNGLLAHEALRVMQQEAGIPFPSAGRGMQSGLKTVDFQRVLRRDTLVRVPPRLLEDTVAILGWFEDWINLSWIMRSNSGGISDEAA